MSGALAPIAMKVIGGGVIGKLVGKATGNDKLGMIAGLATGFAIPGDPMPNTTMDNVMSSAGNVVSTGVDFAKENPNAAAKLGMVGAQAVGGAVGGYEKRNELEAKVKLEREQGKLDRENEVLLQNMKSAESSDAYDRTHQSPSSGFQLSRPTSAPSGGMLSAPAAAAPTQRPMTAPEQYFKQYNDMYTGRVR
jgi:hypothetical protein